MGTIQQSAGALQAAQIGLQVVGNNIANTNTPGYIRQNLEQASAIGVRRGNFIVGHGVRATGVRQQVDQQLIERMLQAKTSLSGAEELRKAYGQLEEITNDLSGNGLNNQFSLFDNAVQELSTQPNDPSLRDFVILQAETLSKSLRTNRSEAVERRELYDGDLANSAEQVNQIIGRIAKLNVDIATIEGGGALGSDATGLRDQRYRDLEDLSQYVDINIQEQSTGVVNIFVGGDYLVSGGNHREVYTAYNQKLQGNEIRIIETDSPLQSTGGLIGAASAARDEVFGSYVDRIDNLTSGLIRAVNEIHSNGQGGRGLDKIQSTYKSEPNVPLADAGLSFVPDNGSFDLNLVDTDGEVISSQRIDVKRLGRVTDSTVSSIVAEIDAIDGLTASVDSNGLIDISSDSAATSFTFLNDNSGFLAAAGINTFFTGKSALDIDVNQKLRENSDFLAVSQSGIGADTESLAELIGVVDRPLDHLGDESVRGRYEQTITGMGQRVALQQSSAEGLNDFYATLQSQHLAITGVNIDEESIRMISYQRAFQASSRVISTASEMLELLVNL